MNNDEKILKALEDLQADVTAMKGDIGKIPAIEKQLEQQGKHIDMLVDTAGHTNTALKAVATKHDVEVAVDAAKTELEARISEVKSDVLMLDSKVAKKIQSHERRITNFEDQTGIENPEKH
jgi:uncharacterized metal-binding protein YceD (DUF177 family)